MRVLRTITNCIEDCDLNQEIKIKSMVENKPTWTPFKIKAKSYRKKDFRDIDFDINSIKYIKDKSLSLTKKIFPEFSLLLYKDGISKEDNITMLKDRITFIGNKLADNKYDPDIILVNLETYNLLSGVEYTKTEIGLEEAIVPTNLIISGMNLYVMEDKLIGNHIIVYSSTKKGREGVYSIINNKRRFFMIDCVGEFNQGLAFKYLN